MQADPSEALLQAVEAAYRLHVDATSADDVVGGLEQTVVELGLADEAVVLPAAVAELTPDGQDGSDGVDLVQVRRPDGTIDGLLRCVNVRDDAHLRLRALAHHAGIALASLARLHDLEHREASLRQMVGKLQGALLPELPELQSTRIGVTYQAAGTDARVGGDFYDVFPLPHGTVLLSVGDVVGKGVEAATRTARISHALRTLALQGLPLAQLLEQVDQQVHYQEPEVMATLWCGLYEPATGELAFGSLGHPPAMLRRADGDRIALELHGLPLGLRDLSPAPPEIRRRKLQARDLLVLYTDGLVEQSGDYLAGQAALDAALTARQDEPVQAIAEGVTAALLGDQVQRDDALLMTVRRL